MTRNYDISVSHVFLIDYSRNTLDLSPNEAVQSPARSPAVNLKLTIPSNIQRFKAVPYLSDGVLVCGTDHGNSNWGVECFEVKDPLNRDEVVAYPERVNNGVWKSVGFSMARRKGIPWLVGFRLALACMAAGFKRPQARDVAPKAPRPGECAASAASLAICCAPSVASSMASPVASAASLSGLGP